MSNFPNSFDDDTTLPAVNDNITEIGGAAINSLRDFAFNTEMYLGLGANGSQPSLAVRLGVSINPDGTINPSALTSLGLVTLPITQDQIANNAGIPESKLMLNHRTNDLFNYIRDLAGDVNTALGWIATTGIELQPHLLGAIYRHSMDQIDVSHDPTNLPFMDNKFRVLRNNTNSYTLVNDINNELLAHQWADGSPFGTIENVVTNDGSTYPSNYAHTASGIFLNTTRFQTIPQTDQDVQSAFEFIDQSSILLLGTRIQNLYANGISVNSRSSSLTADGYGQSIVPVTPAVAFLLYPNGNSSTPVDSISNGDDVIQFMPTDGYSFDEQFALVTSGDIVRINYGTIEVAFVIKGKKYVPGVGGNAGSYYVRIAGKNLFNSAGATARIDRPLFNNNKYGVLAVAAANNPLTGVPSSLIVGSPRAAQALGIGFSPDQFDSTHYFLYLALFPTGSPSDGYTILPAIDVTGNKGATPGAYTLDSIVGATNTAFRQAGFNYRFIAFSYQGEFGIMLADSYNNASFSVISVIITPNGFYDSLNTPVEFPNNVVGPPPTNLPDPLGFGPMGGNVASPPYQASYGSAAAASFPTKLFVPLSRNNYYVNGAEEDRLNLEVGQALDSFGDGYWSATVETVVNNANSVQITYKIPLNLSTSDLKVGKTLVVQSAGTGGLVDFGRFIITNINFDNCATPFTEITVYDAVHATGFSPTAVLPVGSLVDIYFNSDSVSFNSENISDFSAYVPGVANFKRYFEIYVDQSANTYTNERARFNINGINATINNVTLYSSTSLSFVNIVNVSPKLSGFSSSGLNKINLQIFSYDQTTGLFDGYLCQWDGTNVSNPGPFTLGQKGLVTRFYDNTNIDYIDILFNANDIVPSIVSPKNIDIQLFPTLSLDQEIMLLGTCQFNDGTGQVNNLQDERQFGNVSEEQFTTSAIDFIEAATRELQENGIIRGFDILSNDITSVSFNGGVAVVNGKIITVNPQTVDIPAVLEALPTVSGGLPSVLSSVNVITWIACVNNESEIVLIASTDYNPLGPFAAQYQAVSLTHQRLFYAFNPNVLSPSPYVVRGTFFNSLLLTQTDVTPIATITATVTNPGSGYVVSTSTAVDARRYVSSGYGGLSEPLTFGATASFRSFASLTNWLNLLNNNVSGSTAQSNTISNKVIVKGHVIVNATQTLNYLFNEVFFEGDGAGAFDVFVPTGFELGSNVHFHGMRFNYIYDPLVFGDVGYSATDLINTGKGLMHMGVTLGGGNVSVNKCQFAWLPSVAGTAGAPSTSTAVNRYSFINIEMSGPATNAPPVILQDVDISNNSLSDTLLSSFTLPNAESVRAAISLVSLSQVANAAGGGLKLVNVHIDDNFCDKDQLIAITPVNAALTGNIFNSAFNTTNCSIKNNTCGTVAAYTQYDIPIDVDFTTNYFDFNADKNNGLTISGNTCKYITATDARGLELGNITPTVNFNTGPISVFNNTCSWIKLFPNVWATAPGVLPCSVRNNTLLAYDTNFKKNYLAGTATGLTNAAIELVVLGSSLSTIALIDGNNVNAGAYDTIIPAITAFSYDFGIYSSHDINATNNTFLNLNATLGAPNSAIGINLNTSSINVHSDICHNTFYRFGNVWEAYVNLGFAGQHTVAFNFFDQITPDNVHTEFQVIGSAALSNIHDNKNQVINTPISLADGQTYYAALGGPALSATGPAQGASNILTDDVFTFQAVTLAGTFHVINGNNVVNTTSDQTSVLSVGDVVAFTIQAFTYYQITALSSSTITLAVNYFGTTSTATTAAKNGPFLSNPNPGNVQIFKYSQSTFSGVGVQYTGIVEFTLGQSNNYRNITFTIPLSNSLPAGVKILQVQMGVWYQQQGGSSLNTGVDTNNAITLILNQSTDSLLTTAGKVITDVAANIFPTFGGFANTGTDFSANAGQFYTVLIAASPSSGTNYSVVTPATASGGTQFLTITPTPGTYTTGSNKKIFAQVDINFLRTGGTTLTDQIYFYLSPILVSYTW